MVIKFAIKSGIAVGTVYYYKNIGVWGNSVESERLYNEIKDAARPHANQLVSKLPFEVPILPKTGEMCFLAKHYYNNGVKSSIHFIYMIPCYAGQLVKKTKDAVNKALDAPPAKH